jgi:hypothetical protein
MASGSRQPRKGAPNAGSGKSAWRTPIPHLSRFDRKVEPGLIVFMVELKLARAFLFAKISERLTESSNQPKLWDAFTTTSSKLSAARRW